MIVGGSPCQDLSVAGKRAGLDGERSGLFMEQVRLVKEMRERDRKSGRSGFMVRPRYMVWENVPGAFSSNGGEDFKTVIEEIVRIVEPEVPDLHTVVQGGWTKSGCVYSEMGDWSIAWRVHDAQFWGVPQRRKRIALVADFGGLSAPEILFERKGLSRNPEPSGTERKGTAERTEGSSGETGDQIRDGWVESEGTYYDPGYRNDNTICLQGNEIDRADTAGCNGSGWRRGGATPLTPSTGQQYTIPINTMVATRGTPEMRTTFGVGEPDDPQFTLSAAHEHAVMCAGFVGNQGSKAQGIAYEVEKSPTLKAGGWTALPDSVGALCARDSKGVGNQYVNEGKCIIQNLSPE